ncbi:MAG: hypothetical protein HPY74_07310 [Firmicutes bacterium]|nr:hypothetical protein [Bacillota bacterium]
MEGYIIDILNQEEFEKILFLVPRKILIEPFVKSPKKFKKYTRGFRTEKLPEGIIKNAYVENLYQKQDMRLVEFINGAIQKIIIESIDNTIGKDLLEKLKSEENSKEQLENLVSLFIENNIKLDIDIYLKIHSINLSDTLKYYLSTLIDKYEQKRILKNQIYAEVNKSFEEKLREINDEVKEKIRQNEQIISKKLEEKYTKLLREKDKLLKERDAKYEQEMKNLKQQLIAYIEKQDSEFKRLNNDLKRKEEEIRNLKSINKSLQDRITDYLYEKQVIEQQLNTYKHATIQDEFTDNNIREIIEQIKENQIDIKFKEYLNNYVVNSNDELDILDLWTEWVNKEKFNIEKFLNIVLCEQEIDPTIIEKLDDTYFSLDLRRMLVKLFQSIAYEHLSIKKFDEI